MIYTNQYKPAATFIVINDKDPDLYPIRIELPPEPKNLKKVAGWGKPAKNQKWEVDPMPDKLLELEARDDLLTVEDIWEEMEANLEYYKNEYRYIERQWERREKGYWIFINGVPTFIDGGHYFHLNFWHMDIGLPEYRDRDRKWWLTVRHFKEDPLCLGMNYPKHRREGATNRTQCRMYEVISSTRKARGGIQSMTEPHAKDGVFQDHLIAGWKELPFFFLPVHSGTTEPKTALNFLSSGKRTLGGSMRSKKGKALGSVIDFKGSGKSAYDTFKLIEYHGDEVGKTVEVDINKRWSVVRRCLTLGAGKKIIGFCVNTSTVGEMTKGGGQNFAKLCGQSHYQTRNKNGQTISGLYNFFMPATEGLEGFIDEYGNSMTDEATEYIKNTRQGYLDDNDDEGYDEFVRQHPISFRECFRGAAKDCKFNIRIINKRLDEFTFGNNLITSGNFEWEDNIRGESVNGLLTSRVIWEPSPNGKFETSHLLERHESNLHHFDGELILPSNVNRFCSGGDPFKFKRTDGNKPSRGSGAVFMRKDGMIDTETTDINKWITNRFACTYCHRPADKNIYGEDMLKMVIYYGCEMNCEINVPFIWDYFDDRGFGGYLYYGVDRKTGLINKKPGVNTLEGVREDIYREWHAYIQNHGMRECHDRILTECKDIEDDMGPFDQFVSGGLALLAAKRLSFQQKTEELLDVGNYVREYTVR